MSDVRAVLEGRKPYALLQGNALDTLASLPEGSVQCCVTSPPYYGLRSYGVPPSVWGGDAGCEHVWKEKTHRLNAHGDDGAGGNLQGGRATQQENRLVPIESAFCSLCGAWQGCLGLEPTPDLFIEHLVLVFREIRRVLRKDASCWINIGDSFNGSGAKDVQVNSPKQMTSKGAVSQKGTKVEGCKPKDLIGIPWMLAFALRSDGWHLRSEIIWAKDNPMPESVQDRPTRSHEQIFLLTKSPRYFYDIDAIREKTGKEADPDFYETMKRQNCDWTGEDETGRMIRQPKGAHGDYNHPNGRNCRDVWTVNTYAYPDAHFATYPPKLIEPCILAGTSQKGCCAACGAPWIRITDKTRTFESGSGKAGNLPSGKNGEGLQGGGETLDVRRGPCVQVVTTGWQSSCTCNAAVRPCTVLDPFTGSGTTGEVANVLGRGFIGCELNPDYLTLAENRIRSKPYYTEGLTRQKPNAAQPSLFDEEVAA